MGKVYRQVTDNLLHLSGPVVEFGCGNGQYRYGRYCGLDLPGNHYGLPTVWADATRAPILSQSVELVFMVNVLCWSPQGIMLLSEARRILGPGGIFMVFEWPWWRTLHTHPLRKFSRRSLQGLLRYQFGFATVRRYHGWLIGTAGRG